VAKSNDTGTSRYLYAGHNQLLSELTGDTWTNYLWFGGELVSVVRSGQVSYVHSDHLGRPDFATNGSQQTAWKAYNYAYGRSVTQDSIGCLNIGFPGQYYDAETGLWYNGFRHYDAGTARYVHSDPIGLQGGTNTYSYARGNPISRIDLLGLKDCVCGAPAERTETKSNTLTSSEAIDRNEMNNAASMRIGMLAGIAQSLYGPARRVAGAIAGAIVGEGIGKIAAPVLRPGYVETTEISFGSLGGYAVDYTMRDTDGKVIISDSIEKCE